MQRRDAHDSDEFAALSFDHLIGDSEKLVAAMLRPNAGGLVVDDELKLC